jgi:predicted amidohydrolase YtcJ
LLIDERGFLMPFGVDQIAINGRFLTVDSDFSSAEAVAIQGDEFVAVGSRAEIEDLATGRTRVHDLQGATVLPGLIDAHNHMLSTSVGLTQVQLYDCRSIAEILDRVAAAVAEAKPGEWVLGKGWDEALLVEGRFPTRWEFDSVAPDNPVVMHRVWNKLVANSAALAAAGITRETPDPPADMLYAGGFDRDPETGEPNGLFRDRAKQLILRAIPGISLSQMVDALALGSRAYNAAGITGIADPGLFPEQLRAYQVARTSGALSVRADLLLGAYGFAPVDMMPGLQDWIQGYGVHGGFGDDMLRLEGIKFLLDGGVGDRTGRFYEPYLDEPDNYGQWTIDPEEFPHMVRWAHDQGWSIDTHTCGTAAQDLAVRSMIAAQRAEPNSRLRHRIHHGYFPSDEVIPMMAEYRIGALVSTPFITNLGDSYALSLGEERASKTIPMATYLKAGVPVASTSDTPITDFNPFTGMYAAVSRMTVQGRQFDPSESISREDAIRSYTISGAWATGLEHRKGSIEPGKLADMIVLDRDPLTCSNDELRDTVVTRTMVGGSWVYEK